ncbi:hypothetical protein AVEN_211300-1 [Araneus ventricosus]|uniref:Uncharacterized protein n=1 Tax=Araneus ventricosus TaxID=182803 RepID=A0A4Y2WBB5_ARAVE|nr:hypothetical protein AVEN_211300-1 [Araneus ventricosus]
MCLTRSVFQLSYSLAHVQTDIFLTDVFHPKYSRLSINQDRIIRVRDYPGRPPPKGTADCGRWNVREDRILLNPSYCIGLVQPTLNPARLQLDCSEYLDEEAVEQWIHEDSTSECCEVLSDDDIVSRGTCGAEERRNFEEFPESD